MILFNVVFPVKNVAAEIADKLCASIVTKLEGKTIGTFRGKREWGSSCTCM